MNGDLLEVLSSSPLESSLSSDLCEGSDDSDGVFGFLVFFFFFLFFLFFFGEGD